MTLEEQFQRQALVMDLLVSTDISSQQRAAREKVLVSPKVLELIVAEPNLVPVKNKLEGKRVELDERQHKIAVLVNHLYDFERCIGAWLQTRPKKPYAVEHVLAHYDITKNEFTSEGTGASLIHKIDYTDMQTLRTYCRFSTELAKLYRQKEKGRINYTASADLVARILIGRTISLPSQALDSAAAVSAWNAYKDGKDTEYQPILATIIETEGFETNSPVTTSRYCMLAAPGQIDVMPNRGHKLLNIGTKEVESPSCVMLRAVLVEGKAIEGPGRVSEALFAENLIGQFLEKDIPVEGVTAPSGYIPGTASFSTGRHRMQ